MILIDIDRPVAELIGKYPDLKPVLIDAGFKKLAEPLALKTVGKLVSIKAGAEMLGLDLDAILAALKDAGYTTMDSTKQLKEMIARLSAGEPLEEVRKDFVKEFESVSVSDIMAAEQMLMDEGTPQEEIQKLCDLHSALFHGRTELEVLAEEQQVESGNYYLLDLMSAENRELEKRIAEARKILQSEHPDFDALKAILVDLKELRRHYGKKWELIMPFLYVKGMTQPSQVMWGVDDEILRELSRLEKILTPQNLEENSRPLEDLFARMLEMVYKEENILFPLAVSMFDIQDWLKGYQDIDEYGLAWIDDFGKWDMGELWKEQNAWKPEDVKAKLPTGVLDMVQLHTMLNSLPIDITYIDENNNLIFFTNEGHIFSRPVSALGRDVTTCHPPRVVPIMQKMLEDFKAKKKDRVERWIPNPQKPVKVVYQAIYDENGDYKGTVEMVQSFENELPTLKKFIKD